MNYDIEVTCIGKPNSNFDQDIKSAINALDQFLKFHGWNGFDSSLIKRYELYQNKALLDAELLKLSKGKMKTVPKTYVAVAEQRILRVISWEAYQKVFPEHQRTDYVKLLVHEMAHIFHSELVGDDHMGPTWFFEGFAVVAAKQYLDTPSITDSEVKNILTSSDRCSYAKYGFVLRNLMKINSLKEMLEEATKNEVEFLTWLDY